MRLSVVINTYNRAASLRATLDALRHQTFTDFEVIVVDGPSEDGTAELLSARADAVRAVRCPERNLAVSRNLGIDAAAGDVVAFIDDDAIPEARWLADLAAAYDAPQVGGAGGLTLDNTGVGVQYRYSVCDRMARTNFDHLPPFDALNRPGADPYLYLQGTNCSFRRTALAAVEGFDEEIEYNYDESEVCARIIDSGLQLRALEGAVVHHHFLPSHMRRAEGFHDPFLPVKNRVYFALRGGREYHSVASILGTLTRYVSDLEAFMADAVKRGRFTDEEAQQYVARAHDGFALGLERGLAGARKGRPIAAAETGAFLPYPVLVPEGRRLSVCFASMDYPPRPLGGVGRYTHDLARGMAAAGHEVHVVTRDDELPYRVGFEEGVWVHRFPVSERWAPELDGHPLKGNLEHLAAVHSAAERAAERIPFDVVTGSSWVAEPLLCALEDRWVTSAVCVTPMRAVAATQPETAAAPLTPHQIRLEDALLRSPAKLQPISEEVAKLCREVTGAELDVVWLGSADRRSEFPRTRGAGDGAVEILFTGRLEPRKGIDTLLEAAARLLRERPEVRLRVCGPDNPHANGRAGVWPGWVREHAADVAGRIAFDGLLDDAQLMQAYADCDVFCGPSRYESFGLVHVEAMMMGRPVVACDAGGMRETVVDGETGLLVAPGDADALHEALERLVGDADLRRRLGAAGRARYEREFALEVAVARHVARFERLVEQAAAPGAAGTTAGRLAALLEPLCGLTRDNAAAVAEALLDPTRFPVDLEAAVRAALARDPVGMIDGLYEALLGRPPADDGRGGYVARLLDEEDPFPIVREIATGIEAAGRGLDLGFLDRLPDVSAASLQRGLVAACLHDDDDAYAAALHSLLPGLEAPEPLPPGVTRVDQIREILSRPSIRRLVVAEELDLSGLRTESEIAAALAAASDGDFVDTAYRLLLGREADPAGREGYARTARATVVRELGTSAEASKRGFPAAAAERLAARLVDRGRLGRAAGRLGQALVPGAATRADVEAVEQRVAETIDRTLGEPLDGLRQQQHDMVSTMGRGLTEARWAIERLQKQLRVMITRHEALALEVREKLPSTSLEDVPEPVVPDAQALARRIEEIGGLRLNVGCGEKPLPGYVNVDFRPLPGVDVVADVRRLPFEPGTVDELACFHLIEHFREHHVEVSLLPYWRSLLTDEGRLRIVTPNWEVMIEHLLDGRLTFEQFKSVTFGAQDYSGDDHFALYSPQTLERLLRAAGFDAIQVLEDRRQNGLSPEMEVVARVAAGRPSLVPS